MSTPFDEIHCPVNHFLWGLKIRDAARYRPHQVPALEAAYQAAIEEHKRLTAEEIFNSYVTRGRI